MIGLQERKSTAERAVIRGGFCLLSIFAVLFTAPVGPVGGAEFKYGKIEMMRGTWGIPHILGAAS